MKKIIISIFVLIFLCISFSNLLLPMKRLKERLSLRRTSSGIEFDLSKQLIELLESTTPQTNKNKLILEVQELLTSSEAKKMIKAVDKYGNTTLMLALKKNLPQIALRLIEHDAPITKKNKSGYTAFHMAALKGNLDVLKVLIKKTKNPQPQLNLKASCKIKEYCTNATPLHLAAMGNHPNVAKLLLDYNVDCTAQDNDGNTPLHLATTRNNIPLIKLLINRCPESLTITNKPIETTRPPSEISPETPLGKTPVELASFTSKKFFPIDSDKLDTRIKLEEEESSSKEEASTSKIDLKSFLEELSLEYEK